MRDGRAELVGMGGEMMDRDSKARLMAIAGQMVRMEGIPSQFRDDWPDRITWQTISAKLGRMEHQIKEWATEIAEVVKHS